MPSNNTNHRSTSSHPTREKTKKAKKKAKDKSIKPKKSSKNEVPKVTKNDAPKIRIAALQEYEDISPATGEESDSEIDRAAKIVQRSPSLAGTSGSKKNRSEKKKRKKSKGTPKEKGHKHKISKRKRSPSPSGKHESVSESVHSPISPVTSKEEHWSASPVSNIKESKHGKGAMDEQSHSSKNDMEPAKKKSKIHKKHREKTAESPVLPRAYQPKELHTPSPYRSPGQIRSVSPEKQSTHRRSRSPMRKKSPLSNKSGRRHYRSPSRSPYRMQNRPYLSPYRSPFRSPPYRSPYRSPPGYKSPYYSSPYRSPPLVHWSPRRSPGYRGKQGQTLRQERGHSRSRSSSPRKLIRSAIKAMKSKSEVLKQVPKSWQYSETESDNKHSFRKNLTSYKKHETSHRKSPVRRKEHNSLGDRSKEERTYREKSQSSSSSSLSKRKDLKVDTKSEPVETMSLVSLPVRTSLPQPPPLPPPPPAQTDGETIEEVKPPLPSEKLEVPLPDKMDNEVVVAPPLPDVEPPPLPPEDDAPTQPALPPLPLPPVLPSLPDESPGSESSRESDIGKELTTAAVDSKPTTPSVMSTPGKSDDESDEDGEWGERCVDMFDIIAIVGEGTFGQVYKAKEKETGLFMFTLNFLVYKAKSIKVVV